jgi:hypothetical protein
VRNKDKYICEFILSSIISHPKKTPNMGVKNEKELVLLAECLDITHSQPIKPMHITKIT